MKELREYRETPRGKERRQMYHGSPKQICPACGKDFTDERFLNKNLGLCWDCFQSLNSWLLEGCKEYNYTDIRTGLVMAIALRIAEWLKGRR